MHAEVGEPLSSSKLLVGSEINPLLQDTRHSPTSCLWRCLTSCLEYLRKETLSYLLKFCSLFMDSLTYHLFRELFLSSPSQKNVDPKSVCLLHSFDNCQSYLCFFLFWIFMYGPHFFFLLECKPFKGRYEVVQIFFSSSAWILGFAYVVATQWILCGPTERYSWNGPWR